MYTSGTRAVMESIRARRTVCRLNRSAKRIENCTNQSASRWVAELRSGPGSPCQYKAAFCRESHSFGSRQWCCRLVFEDCLAPYNRKLYLEEGHNLLWSTTVLVSNMPPKKPSSSSEDQPPPPHRSKFLSILPNVTQEDDAGTSIGPSPGSPAQGDARERQSAPAETHAGEPFEDLADDEPGNVHPTASSGDIAGN